jgi:Zn-dependent peptidase ImmA (M78 family)
MSNDNPGQLARAAARRELEELHIESLDEIDVEAIAAYRRLFIVEGDLHGAEGRSVTHGGSGIIRIRADITQAGRRRFIVAHEIGHCVIHKAGSVTTCSEGDLFRYEEGNREAEANWFAAELLMPGKLFRPLCNVPRPTFDAIGEIARKCGTTLTAAMIRFVHLGPERCAFVWSEDNKVKWSVQSPDFPEWIARGRVLSGLSHAADVFRGRAIPLGLQPVPQHAWLDKRVLGGRDVMEETIAFRKLGAALTLLWFPMEADEDERDDDDDDVRWRR